MKYLGMMIGFCALLAVAFYVGYNTEITADAGASPADYGIGNGERTLTPKGGVNFGSSQPQGGVRFGSDGASAHR